MTRYHKKIIDGMKYEITKERRMAGTKLGGKRAAETNIKKYGADFYAKIGAIGGKKSGADLMTPKGFAAMTPAQRSAAGKLGGSVSRK